MGMEHGEAAYQTVLGSIQALGRGFDVNFDTRLLYCKAVAGSRIVEVNEHTRDLLVGENIVVPGVSRDIKCYPEKSVRESTGVYNFNEMAEYFNRKASLSGSIPLGSFNAAFSFTGLKRVDSEATKCLLVDGVFVPLFNFQLAKSVLRLKEDVKHAVPSSWDPQSLSSFIGTFGTHVITSVTVGGKDVIYVKQNKSSSLSAMEVKKYVDAIGNHRFLGSDSHTSTGPEKLVDKGLDSNFFNSQEIYPQPSSYLYPTGKEDVTVIFRRRGGDDVIQSHMEWMQTVIVAPDVINMTFCPIISLLDEVPGKDHLMRAIALYLEYKPPVEELRYFLEFQIPRIWAPIQENLVGIRRKEPVCPSLQFSIMGPRLYISQEQVSIKRRPVTGMRLCPDGAKMNRLCIQLQHLVSLPKILQPHWDTHVAIGAPKWKGPEEQDTRWFEPVKWKNYSYVSTAPIEYNETFIGDLSGVSIVTGAQLGVWDFGSRNVLFMKLLYSKLPGCTIRRSLWDHNPVMSKPFQHSLSSGDLSSHNMIGKLVKIVDLSEMTKGPEDMPGHWVVTGGKLGVEKGKIVLRAKYSLLNF